MQIIVENGQIVNIQLAKTESLTMEDVTEEAIRAIEEIEQYKEVENG